MPRSAQRPKGSRQCAICTASPGSGCDQPAVRCGPRQRREAILELRDVQVDWGRSIVDLNPPGRAQNKKFRPTVRLPSSLAETTFTGLLVSHRGEEIDSVKTGWRKARDRAGLDKSVNPYSLRHTAARWMRMNGVSEWDTQTQLGHRRPGVTERYTAYDPEYLKDACTALDKLVRQVRASDVGSKGLARVKALNFSGKMVLPGRIELTTSPLPRECSTTELRQHRPGGESASGAPARRGRSLPQGIRRRKRIAPDAGEKPARRFANWSQHPSRSPAGGL